VTASRRARPCGHVVSAIEFLSKPFRDQDFLDAFQLALAHDRARRENEGALADQLKLVPEKPQHS
jgi:FixJ family two-component response regulator